MTSTELDTWDVDFGGQRVVHRAGAIDGLGSVARRLGMSRVLLVTDDGMRRVGHVDRALAALATSSVQPVVYDGVEENPSTAHVEAGRALAASHDVDGIVGLGGGSALDCSKGINFVLTGGGSMEDYWGKGRAREAMLPSVGIPTTAGTGSESQSFALISQAQSGIKMACGDKKAAFRAVLLDPALARTAPRVVIAAAGIDAVSHVIESYVSTARNPLSMMFGREAWKLLNGNLEAVLSGTASDHAWGRMQLGSFLAGAAIEHSMLGAAHSCANPLTTRHHVVHGEAVGMMLPHVMRLNAGVVAPLYDGLASAGSGGAALIERVEGLRAAAGFPVRLRDRAVPREMLSQLANDASKQWTASFNPVTVGQQELLALYEAAW